MERIEAELVAHAKWEATGMAHMLELLGEFDRRQGWATWGCVSAIQWLSWLSPSTTMRPWWCRRVRTAAGSASVTGLAEDS
jgi:hypothetical protein